jgi:hypothetical protein
VKVRQAARARRDHDEVQAELACAGRRAAAARRTDTPPAVFAVAPDEGAVILRTDALSVQVGAGRLCPSRPVPPPVDHAHSRHLSVSHP